MRLRAAVALVGTGLTAAAVVTPVVAHAAKSVTTTNGCVVSVPDPGSTTPVKICYTIFQPPAGQQGAPGADGHAQPRLGRLAHDGPGVVRGQASSTPATACCRSTSAGSARAAARRTSRTPTSRASDVEKLVDLVSNLHWVRQDGPGDPRLGAIGG